MLTATLPKCKQCRQRVDRAGLKVHIECVDAWWAGEKARKAAREAKKNRAALKAFKDRNPRIRDLVAAAQVEFNRYIRLRDRLAGHACISSGRPLDWSGNNVDAGHYRSTGAAPHLRFNEDNCHAQSKQDNRYLAGNAADYRIGLVARIGVARVEALEADAGLDHKWKAAELIEIKALYRAKCKELEKEC